MFRLKITKGDASPSLLPNFNDDIASLENEHGKLIIGLGYKARSGKDAAADYLVRRYGFRRIAFADHLKSVVGLAFGFDTHQMYGADKLVVDPRWGNTPVHFLQQVGTDLFRKYVDEDFWAKAVLNIIHASDHDRWVITDTRFPNEAELIHSNGGYVFEINRAVRPDAGRDTNHPSETSMDGYDGWDAIIYNNKGLTDLYDNVIDACQYLARQYQTYGKPER